jgi:hypothetical protein
MGNWNFTYVIVMLNKIFDELNSQVSSELILLIGGILIIVLITINLYKNYMFNTYYSLNNSEIPDFNQSINKVSGRFKNF